MKCLTVKQPWAEAIVRGIKDVENRSWPTNHRGLLLIHAGLSVDWNGVMRTKIRGPYSVGIIGFVEIVGCIRYSDSRWAEHGAWHWELQNAIRFERPIPCQGQQRLFPCPDPQAVIHQMRTTAQLREMPLDLLPDLSSPDERARPGLPSSCR